MNLQSLKTTVLNKTAKSRFIVKKHSPEILIGVGIVSIIAGTVVACKATLKVDEVLAEAENNFEAVREVLEDKPESYTQEDAAKDRTIIYVQTGVKLVKMYAPAVALSVVGIACIMKSHKIMTKRNATLLAAYKVVEKAYDDYRERVIQDVGTDKDFEYRHGVKKETVTKETVDENGKKKKTKETISVVDSTDPSEYSRFFDEYSTQWVNTPEYNLIFLKCQQNYANDKLKARGHLFLNEVYEMLGIPHSQAGAVVGWVIGEDFNNFVDFGIYDINRPKAREFVNGYEASILLDFNVDGIIVDKI